MAPLDTDRTTTARGHLERGYRFEQSGTVDRALDAYREALALAGSPVERAEAHLRIARALRAMSQWDDAISESRAAVKLADAARQDDLAAEAMNVELGVLQLRGLFDEADAVGKRALERARSPRVRGITLQNLGIVASERSDAAAADQYFAQSVEALRAAEYELGLAIALNNRAVVARNRGDARLALELAHEAADLCRRMNALDVLLGAVQNQAHALVTLGSGDQAEELLTEALGYFTSARNLIGQAECLEIMGKVSELRGTDEGTARRCYERAREIAEVAGARAVVERLNQLLKERGAA